VLARQKYDLFLRLFAHNAEVFVVFCLLRAGSTIPANRSLEEPAAISAVGVSISFSKGDRVNEEKFIDSVLVGVAF
jgi:hypothetical protein